MIHQMKATSVSSQHLRHATDGNEINKAVTEVQYCTSHQETRSHDGGRKQKKQVSMGKIKSKSKIKFYFSSPLSIM